MFGVVILTPADGRDVLATAGIRRRSGLIFVFASSARPTKPSPFHAFGRSLLLACACSHFWQQETEDEGMGSCNSRVRSVRCLLIRENLRDCPWYCVLDEAGKVQLEQ